MKVNHATQLERMGVNNRQEAEAWDSCVATLLGPRMPSEEKERRRRDALELAAAALRAAGERGLVQEVSLRLANLQQQSRQPHG